MSYVGGGEGLLDGRDHSEPGPQDRNEKNRLLHPAAPHPGGHRCVDLPIDGGQITQGLVGDKGGQLRHQQAEGGAVRRRLAQSREPVGGEGMIDDEDPRPARRIAR